MAYNLTLTNGTSLVTLPDGTADTSTTSINLVGKNFAGYGLYLNSNFIKILENFASATAPSNPLDGQLWWDTVNKHLAVWQGSVWKVISSSQTGVVAPPQPVVGDFWWDTATSQFKVYSGSAWISIGPTSPPGVAVTSFIGNTLTDSSSLTHVVGNVVVNNKLTAIFSSDATPFTLSSAQSGLTKINPGINFVSAAESTMISSPNMTLGVVNGNVQVTTGNNYGFVVVSNIGGVLTNSLVVSGATGSATFGGNVTFSGNVAYTGNISYTGASQGPITLSSIDSNIIPTANLTYNLGSTTSWWNNIYGTAVHAKYADLAERFEADTYYMPGTVMELGGEKEVTAVNQDLSEIVFGVISTNAAYLMNSGAGSNDTHPPVAVQGRVPVRVIGKIKKGDRLVSAGKGIARAGAKHEISAWNVIGRALENKLDDGEGMIEAVVKLNS